MTLNSQILDDMRREAAACLDQTRRGELGQFLTPSSIACFMAGLFEINGPVRLLDPGAGVGSLSAAFLERALGGGLPISVEAWEIDPVLRDYLERTYERQVSQSKAYGAAFQCRIHTGDFIEDGVVNSLMRRGTRFTHAILNPPYKKIASASRHRNLLSKAGIETVNLYAAFTALAIELVEDGGEIVAIIPRSFCNGAYYRPFRSWLLERCAIRQIHLFSARDKAFGEDGVLQENIIIHLVRGVTQRDVMISGSSDASFTDMTSFKVDFEDILEPDDPDLFIRIPSEGGMEAGDGGVSSTLRDIGLDVSTGPVVDFRLRDFWRMEMADGAAPLIYAHHFLNGRCAHPQSHPKKPNALIRGPEVDKWLMPNGHYVLVRRFSAKEERRRLVASVVSPEDLSAPLWGFENHLNVFHQGREGLDEATAWGLATYLNSTQMDLQFRIFSGHTQVNATDLRSMRYPTRETLMALGLAAKSMTWEQACIDRLVQEIGGSRETSSETHPRSHRGSAEPGYASRPVERTDGHLPLGIA